MLVPVAGSPGSWPCSTRRGSGEGEEHTRPWYVMARCLVVCRMRMLSVKSSTIATMRHTKHPPIRPALGRRSQMQAMQSYKQLTRQTLLHVGSFLATERLANLHCEIQTAMGAACSAVACFHTGVQQASKETMCHDASVDGCRTCPLCRWISRIVRTRAMNALKACPRTHHSTQTHEYSHLSVV